MIAYSLKIPALIMLAAFPMSAILEKLSVNLGVNNEMAEGVARRLGEEVNQMDKILVANSLGQDEQIALLQDSMKRAKAKSDLLNRLNQSNLIRRPMLSICLTGTISLAVGLCLGQRLRRTRQVDDPE